jgi:hypothetical protein
MNREDKALVADLLVLLRDACALAHRLERTSANGKTIDLALTVRSHLNQARGNLDAYSPPPWWPH